MYLKNENNINKMIMVFIIHIVLIFLAFVSIVYCSAYIYYETMENQIEILLDWNTSKQTIYEYPKK